MHYNVERRKRTFYLSLVTSLSQIYCGHARLGGKLLSSLNGKKFNKILGDEVMKKMTKAMLMTALILGSVQWGGTPVHASELDTFTLDEYVVTATRTPVELFNANANISVVTKEQIENRHYQNVKEALEDVPGVQIREYGMPGYVTSNKVVINGSPKVLLMVDGIRMNQGAESNLYELLSDMENIERIEVLHGSASSLYGADAQGGVINVITNKKPHNKTKFFIEGGDFSKTRMGLSTQGSENGWSYRIAGTKSKIGDAEDGRGEELKQSDDAKTFNAMVSKQLGENGDKGDITVSYDKYKTDFAYEIMHAYDYNYDEDGKFAGQSLSSKNGEMNYGSYETESYRMIFNYNFDDTLTNRFTLSRNERLLNNPDAGVNNITSVGVTDQLTKQFGGNNTFTIGFDHQTDKFQEGYGYDWYSGADMNGTKLKNTGIYVQDIHNFTDKLNLTLGARYDDNNLFDSEFTGNGKVGYKFTEDTNVYVSYGTFFNTPGVYELFNGKYGNSDLKPENGKNMELGINHKIDDTFVVSAHIFKRETDDKVYWEKKLQKYTNLDTTEDAKGFDIQLKKKFSDKWDASVAYTYTKTEGESNGTKVINNFGYIPKHTIDIGVDYKLNKFNANLTAKGIIDKPGYSDTPGYEYAKDNFPCDSYWVVDLGMNYKPTENYKFYIKVNNLFDKFYANESNVAWGAAGEWWGMPGRAFFVGMEYSF